jgi:hypothetical protein
VADSSNTPSRETRIGGLTVNQRSKFFRLQRTLAEAATNCYMRLNDNDRRSFRARTLAAKKMVECARDIYRLVART